MTIEHGEPKPCQVLLPSDDFWPAYIEDGYIIHSGHDDEDRCNPWQCCIVASLDGLVEPVDEDEDEDDEACR